MEISQGCLKDRKVPQSRSERTLKKTKSALPLKKGNVWEALKFDSKTEGPERSAAASEFLAIPPHLFFSLCPFQNNMWPPPVRPSVRRSLTAKTRL